eukprot:6080780-Pleurochrysis_carterae.AAC.1
MPRQLEAHSARDRFDFSLRQTSNAAKALAHLELAFPVETKARETGLLLIADNATPLTPSQADKLLASLL